MYSGVSIAWYSSMSSCTTDLRRQSGNPHVRCRTERRGKGVTAFDVPRVIKLVERFLENGLALILLEEGIPLAKTVILVASSLKKLESDEQSLSNEHEPNQRGEIQKRTVAMDVWFASMSPETR
jgi:hypothetical protein